MQLHQPQEEAFSERIYPKSKITNNNFQKNMFIVSFSLSCYDREPPSKRTYKKGQAYCLTCVFIDK